MILKPTRFRISRSVIAQATGEHEIRFRMEDGLVVVEIDAEQYFAITPEFGRKLVLAIGQQAAVPGVVDVFLNGRATMKLTAQAAQAFCRELWQWCKSQAKG